LPRIARSARGEKSPGPEEPAPGSGVVMLGLRARVIAQTREGFAMWITLFSVVTGLAISFALGAVLLEALDGHPYQDVP